MAERLSGAASRAVASTRIAGCSYRPNLSLAKEVETPTRILSSDLTQSCRSFTSTSSSSFSLSKAVQAGGYQRELSRQKRYERSALREKRIEGRREKDSYGPRFSSPDERPRNLEQEELEAQIQAYMASTGPKGERLNFRQKEKLLKVELGTLGKELEKVEKKIKSDEETAHLPALDDQLLGDIYKALMLPPPPSGEETRLARLASGRKEQKLLESVRGRRELEILRISALPPTISDVNRSRVSRSLRQKLIDATERSRTLLPPTVRQKSASVPSSYPASTDEYLTDKYLSAEEQPEMEEYFDLTALPQAERQEIRLQQLFARLAVVNPSAETSESLKDLRSSLASRIAKILESHEYLLPTAPPSQENDNNQLETEAANQTDSSTLAEFEPLRLDKTVAKLEDAAEASGLSPQPGVILPVEAQKNAEMLMKADSMLQNLDTEEARNFMLESIERLLPPTPIAEPSISSLPTHADFTSDQTATAPDLPLGIVSFDEWTALAVSSARADDWASLSRTMSLMERAGYFPPPLALYNNILDVYAARGDVASCLQILSMLSATDHTADNHTYHCLTKVYVETAQFAKAIELLNSLEEQSRPAAMATYTLLISRLMDFAGRDSLNEGQRPELQSLAWSVFHHMRLVAHPVPDAPLYALMIRACAKGVPQPQDIDDPSKTFTSLTSGASFRSGSGFVGSRPHVSEAERALDLFREMTTRYGVRPNAEVYNNLILACARRKDFYLEAFRLLREMVGLENERVGLSPDASSKLLRFAPDRYTFNALLQGCARNRDLPRARWVLAEMIRTTLPLFDDEIRPQLTRAQKIEMLAKRPNEETLCHLFHAYASFVPTIQRKEMRLQDSTATSSKDKIHAEVKSDDDSSAATNIAQASTTSAPADVVADEKASDMIAQDPLEENTTAEEAAHVFSALVPQTSADVLSEARSLFARVLADQPQNGVEGPLGAVKPSIRLVNAYLTVLAAHLPEELKARVMGSVLFGDPRTRLLEKAALTLRSDSQSISDTEQTLEESLIARLGLAPNEHTFKVLLQAYSLSPLKTEEAVRELADQVQIIWDKFNDYMNSNTVNADKVDTKQIKNCWTAYIRFWAKHPGLSPTPDSPHTSKSDTESTLPGLDTAMNALKKFAELYPPRPPESLHNGTSRPRSALYGPASAQLGYDENGQTLKSSKGDKTERLLQRLDLSPFPIPQKSLESLRILASLESPAIRSKDSSKPSATTSSVSDSKAKTSDQFDQHAKRPGQDASLPTLSFIDVELLHHRLVRYSRVKDLAYLSWLLRRSTAASRPRRPQF